MYRIVSKGRNFLRALAIIGGREIKSDTTCRRNFSFVTSVSGFDNKHAHYELKPKPLRTFGDDAYFISVTDASCVLGIFTTLSLFVIQYILLITVIFFNRSC